MFFCKLIYLLFLSKQFSCLSFRLCDALAGRMFAVGLYYVALQFSLEVLPTVIRGSGAAACEIFGGLGVFLCPQIVYLVRPVLLVVRQDLPLL